MTAKSRFLQVTVHADVTIASTILVRALTASARDSLVARKTQRFDLSGSTMAVDGRSFPQTRFEARI